MSRKEQKQGEQTYKQSQALTNQYDANAKSVYSSLAPTLQQEASNPEGLTPEQKRNMLTASEQSLGGSQAGAVGAGNLEAARSRSVGGADAAIADSSRAAMRQQSVNALGVEGADAALEQEQRQAGLKGQENLLGIETQSTLNALGAQNESTKTQIEAGKSGWFQNMINGINAASNAAQAAASLGVKPCWVAAELYGGWDSPQTTLLRNWMVNDWKTISGRAFVFAYRITGKAIAGIIRRSKLARTATKYVFDKLLLRAERESR